MKEYRKIITGWISAVCLSVAVPAYGQEVRVCMDSVRARLDRVVKLDSVYLSEVDVSVGSLPIGELFRNIAKVHEVNLCVKVNDNRMVTCNFNRVRLVDLLSFLCREYNLELEVVGNIVSLSAPVAPVAAPKIPCIGVDSTGRKLFYDLLDDHLVEVVKRISALTGENIVIPRELYPRQISGFSAGLPIVEAIQTLAFVNGLEIERGKSGTWQLQVPEQQQGMNRPLTAPYSRRRSFANDQVIVDTNGRITVALQQGNIHDIALDVCERFKLSYLFLSSLDQQTSMFVKDIELSDFFHILFAGTPFTCELEKGIYIFGSLTKEKSLVTTRVIPMRYRTVEKVVDLIPVALKENMQLQVYSEQNSIIVSGGSRQVERIREFLESIDESIPLVTIEVLIVDSKKSMIDEIGIEMGIGEPQSKSKILSPGVNMLLNSNSVNKLINSFNGFGSINLGKVTPDFYMSIQALESRGNIEVRSTPKLSTLNGHKAFLKSGEKKYYKEVQTNYYGSQTPVPSESYTWKEVNADLSLEITPFVSKDGKITLDIKIKQSQFTEREGKVNEEAPPGAVTREFESQIQVFDQEMVLLGGIDNNSKENSSSGLPLIARIPVLKWFFGKTKNNKVDQKLNVFIKPNVIY